MSLSVVVGDITKLAVDAIVNAANSSLLGGGGVDGAIHDAAGPELREACRPLAPCPTGEARITPGFALPARYVIHTVGPVWQGGEHDEAALLASCYRASLELAVAHGVASIAFPAISTGAFRFPLRGACEIAVATVRAFVAKRGAPDDVRFCMFDARAAGEMRAALL
jgi:O-acetyl-ADP-ribose deacetylase (regulator of RNase III)